MSRTFNAEQFARELGYPNVQAFNRDRKEGLIPIQDGETDGEPFWYQETVTAFRDALVRTITTAFGRPMLYKGSGRNDGKS